MTYANAFVASSNIGNYRPPRVTQKKRVYGPTTAIVTGPSGEANHTDEFGRIKVQFHWDRYSTFDENSSAWLRVMIPAGRIEAGRYSQNLARQPVDTALYLPQIGAEVVVDFFDGDPDQPFVKGSVYNDNSMPPFSLPEYKLKSIEAADHFYSFGHFSDFHQITLSGEFAGCGFPPGSPFLPRECTEPVFDFGQRD